MLRDAQMHCQRHNNRALAKLRKYASLRSFPLFLQARSSMRTRLQAGFWVSAAAEWGKGIFTVLSCYIAAEGFDEGRIALMERPCRHLLIFAHRTIDPSPLDVLASPHSSGLRCRLKELAMALS